MGLRKKTISPQSSILIMRCEDYPCCGHEPGGCPNEDGTFNCCRCGRRLERNARSAMCAACHRKMQEREEEEEEDFQD